jgi:tetratricopeptide (TPR) repeat protein
VVGVVAGGALVALLAGAFLLRPSLLSGRDAARSPAANGTVALPDAPSPAEQALLQALATAAPQDPAPARTLGDFYRDQARPFAALWAYAFALHARPKDPAATLGLAQALERALFPEAAIARLRGLLAPAAGPPEVVAPLAELYLRTGRPEAALAVVQGAAPSYRGSGAGALLEGRVREALGDLAGAAGAYRRSVGEDGPEAEDAPAWHRLGRLALAQGRRDDARQAFAAARVLMPTSPQYWVDFGRTYADSPKPEERRAAPEYYVKAMNQDLRFAPAHCEAGLWYARQSRWREAIERFQSAVEAEPTNAAAHEQLARALEATGRKAEAAYHRGLALDARNLRAAALRQYQAWAALDRDNPDADLQVSQTYFAMNQLEPARARLQKARQRHPHHAGIRERLIAFHLLAGERAQARQMCEAWLKEEPGAPRALWMLGRAAADERRLTDAVRLYEQALTREPDNAEFLGALGDTLLKLPGPEAAARAIAMLSRAVQQAPDEPRWRAALAQALQQGGRPVEARRLALRALDLDPHQSTLYNMVVQLARQERAEAPLALYAPLVRVVEARLRDELALWQATWERPQDPRGYEALARFLIRTGELAAAESQLAEAVRLRPSNSQTRAQLALIRRLRQVE